MADRMPNQPSPKKKTFFKVLESDFSEFSQHLKIPPNFVKNFNGEPPCRCALIGPSATRSVELEKREDGLFFHDLGWQGFVKDHALETGDFLVFSYNNGSNFNVTVFDNSLCEKDIEAAKRRSAGSSVSLGNKGNQAGAKNAMIDLESQNKNEDCGNNHVSLVNKGNQAPVKVELDSETDRNNEGSEEGITIAKITSGKKKKTVMQKKHHRDPTCPSNKRIHVLRK